jgi:deoxycytidylate deaminase
MTSIIPRIDYPELYFGFVAPIGVELDSAIDAFRRFLESNRYKVITLRATDIFKNLKSYEQPKQDLSAKTQIARYDTYIAYGNQIREAFNDDGVLAAFLIGRINQKRTNLKFADEGDRYSKTAFLLRQFKRKEEIDLLRSVYGRLFFQVSVYSRRGARIDYLSRRFASDVDSADAQPFRSDAERILQKDEDEKGVQHGQRVARIFHDADLIINADAPEADLSAQVVRFCELIFGSNSISPSKIEYGMFVAKSAALRTIDLSRQVGAAIFTTSGEVVSLGSNEVPKAGGGTYWSDNSFDDRDYKRGFDANDKRKRELFRELMRNVDPNLDVSQLLKKKEIIESQFMDALEYGRVVHAEMSAISDAARLGRSVRGASLFTTTFPCHLCAKHIVASGLSKVVFLEPYPKSLASELHSDSIAFEKGDRGKYSDYPAVEFEHFAGITPNRYRELFLRGSRKNEEGAFVHYRDGYKRPIIDIKAPFYIELERVVMTDLAEMLIRKYSVSEDVFAMESE